jgi:hypothetical protein
MKTKDCANCGKDITERNAKGGTEVYCVDCEWLMSDDYLEMVDDLPEIATSDDIERGAGING